MSGSWSNPGTDLIVLTEEASGFSGLFGYSPSVGAGNLVFAVAAQGGTDPYGNKYLSGVTVYGVAGGTEYFSQLNNGSLAFGQLAAPANEGILGFAFINLQGTQYQAVTMISPTTATATYASAIFLIPNVTTGPAMYVVEPSGNLPANLFVSGTVAAVSVAGTPVATTVVGAVGAPAYGTNWAANSAYGSIGSCESLRFQLTPDGHTNVHGAFKTGASAPGSNTVFTLPTGYYRTDRAQLFTWHARIAPAANETIGTGSVDTSGNVSLSSTNTGSTSPLVANSTFWMSFTIDGPGVY